MFYAVCLSCVRSQVVEIVLVRFIRQGIIWSEGRGELAHGCVNEPKPIYVLQYFINAGDTYRIFYFINFYSFLTVNHRETV